MRHTMRFGWLGTLIVLLLAPAVGRAAAPQISDVKDIQARNESQIMAMKGVRGIGIGVDGEGQGYVFHVFVNDKDGVDPNLPKTIEGVKVKVLLIPEVVAQQALMGTSTSNPNGCYAGTTGYKVKYGTDKCKWGYITNNHVAVPAGPNLCPNLAGVGTNEYSPGTLDNACTTATDIGDLFSFVNIAFGGPANQVDGAFVANNNMQDVDVSNQIACGIGAPTLSIIPPLSALGMDVRKCGRTTGYTTGSVATVNVSLNVNYGAGCGIAFFTGQLHIVGIGGPFSAPGDSGSPIVNFQNDPVGLLFAGGGGNTFANPIGDALAQLNCSLVGPNEAYPPDCKQPPDDPCNCGCSRQRTQLSGVALTNLTLFSVGLHGNIDSLRNALVADQAEMIAIADEPNPAYAGAQAALQEFQVVNLALVEATFSVEQDPPSG